MQLMEHHFILLVTQEDAIHTVALVDIDLYLFVLVLNRVPMR